MFRCDHTAVESNPANMNHRCSICGAVLDEVAMELRQTVIDLRAEIELLRKQFESGKTTELDSVAAIALKGLSAHYLPEDAARYAYEHAHALFARKMELAHTPT